MTKKLLCLALVLVGVSSSFAQTQTLPIVLRWTPPTQNTDGSSLTNLANYRVYCATSTAGVPTATPIVVPAPASAYTVQTTLRGTVYCGVKAVSSASVESDVSNLISKVVIAAPRAPTNLTVE